MASLTEKRKLVAEWLEVAEEDEVDALLESIQPSDADDYEIALLEELDLRRARHLSGESKTYTLDELNMKLDALLKNDV
jgi:hypothetical protein